MIALAGPRKPETAFERRFFDLFKRKENLLPLQREYVEILEEILKTNATFDDDQTYFLMVTYVSMTYPLVWDNLNDEALNEFRRGCVEFNLLP